jgi:hypothetical protein
MIILATRSLIVKSANHEGKKTVVDSQWEWEFDIAAKDSIPVYWDEMEDLRINWYCGRVGRTQIHIEVQMRMQMIWVTGFEAQTSAMSIWSQKDPATIFPPTIDSSSIQYPGC